MWWTFGILSSRCRILKRTIIASPDTCIDFIKATCVLHNYLVKTDTSNTQSSRYCPPNFVDTELVDGFSYKGLWRNAAEDYDNFLLGRGVNNSCGRAATTPRDKLAFFMFDEDLESFQLFNMILVPL